MKLTSFILSLLVGCMILAGCGRKAITRKYYVLALTRSETASRQTGIRLPYAVDVRDFSVAKPVDQTRIALRTDTHEINYYFYHHWAVRPGEAVADMLFANFLQSKLFERLSRGYSSTPQYVISGSVNQMERREEGKHVFAHLSMSLQLVDMDTRKPLIEHQFDRRLEVSPPKSMNAFSGQISLILQTECDSFREQIINALSPAENDR